VHCATSAFSGWSTCTAACATGTQSRSRTVTSHAAHGGYTCPYLAETRNCNTQACPINGGWSGYGGWGGCSKTCDGGTKYRSRSCTNPSPAHGGAGCSGGTTDSTSCNTQACVTSCSANGMQAHYTFDGHWDASSTGSHNWATSKHGSSYAVTGKHSTALNFDGNDRIEIHANGQVSETNFGVSLWFKTPHSNAGGLFCVSLHGANDRHFGINANRIYIRTWPHGAQHPGTSGMASNTWRHAVYTVGPSGEKIFVDGTLIHHRGITSSSYNWDNKAWIGWSDDRGYFHGQIDDVRIYSHELSQTEVNELNNGCAQSQCGITPGSYSSNGLHSHCATPSYFTTTKDRYRNEGYSYQNSACLNQLSNGWIQEDLGSVRKVTGVRTGGRPNGGQWVTRYQIMTSTNGHSWTDAGTYTGNSDATTIVTRDISPVQARYVRLYVRGYSGYASLRMDVTTC
jgi:hypothetical protein